MSYTVKMLPVLFCIIFSSNNVMGSYDPEKERLGKRPQLQEATLEEPDDKRQILRGIDTSIKPVFVNELSCAEGTGAARLGAFRNLEEMNRVFEDAPPMAKMIISRLKNPFLCESIEDRAAIFFGPPGTGKTSVAHAIAYKMAIEAGWESSFFSSSEFVGGQRNNSARELRLTLNEIAAREKPNIVVINELNQLLENADSSHHDTDATSKALWEFLDAQSNNHRFFLIGTMNTVSKLPVQLKSRWMYCCVKFTELVDVTKKIIMFRNCFKDKDFQLSDEIDDLFLATQLAHEKDSTYRGFYGFSCMTKNICGQYGLSDKKNIVGKDYIQQAVRYYQEMFQEMKFDVLQETDVERQERYHQQQRADQAEQFIIQQLITYGSQASLVMRRALGDVHSVSAETVAIIRGTFTEEQCKFLDAAIARAKRAHDEEMRKRSGSGCALQ